MKPGYKVDEFRPTGYTEFIVVDNVEETNEVVLWYCDVEVISYYIDHSTIGVWKLKERKQ